MRITTFILLFVLLLGGHAMAQSGAEWQKQAESSLQKHDHVQARYQFQQAYQAYANAEQYAEATATGVKACALYYQYYAYKEAFDLCRQIDYLILTGEQKFQRPMPELHFLVAKERMQMYVQLKNSEQAQVQLSRMQDLAGQAGNQSLNDELLYTQAGFYYTFGQDAKGDDCFQQLVTRYKEKKEYNKVSECYKNLISIASAAGNAPLVEQTYEKYIIWTDSVKALNAQDEYNILKKQYEDSLQTVTDRDDTIRGKQYLIVSLCTLLVILGIVLVVGGLGLMRLLVLNRKLKNNIQIANEHNELKSRFICSVSSQMKPTLDSLAQTASLLQSSAPVQAGLMIQQLQALDGFASHIEELSSLENTLMEPFETQPVQTAALAKRLQEQAKGWMKPGVELAVDVASLEIRVNAAHLERVLLHLLQNAADHTDSGKVKLEFKKRGAHIGQFIVTDTGSGIAEELRPDLFKPFSEPKVLSEGDGLGLPICALIAAKMNGSLTLDPDYKRGCRFVLGLSV
ncbi:MAG: HAMP domain-containing histidine kinase [Parabacteroides sp.]|nr:HAMP domain-containing histidine kinase [Parabacteroides sp.]